MDDERQGFINYDNGIVVSQNSNYTAPSNGLFVARINQTDNSNVLVTIEGHTYLSAQTHASYLSAYFFASYPLSQGQTARFYGSSSNSYGWFFPYTEI